MFKHKRPATRAGWVILALIIANEIRGILVVLAIAPSAFRAITG